MIKFKKQHIKYRLVILLGILMFFFMFYSEYSNLSNWYSSSVRGKVTNIEKTHSGGGPVFKLDGINRKINMHLEVNDENKIRIGDSIKKESYSTEIMVFRRVGDKWKIVNKFSINNSETFYNWVVD